MVILRTVPWMDQWIFYGITVKNAFLSHNLYKSHLYCFPLSSSTDEGPPCTCPLCASDWSSCVPHSEGLQLSRDLGATYLELPSLNNFFVGRYFGSVVSVSFSLNHC